MCRILNEPNAVKSFGAFSFSFRGIKPTCRHDFLFFFSSSLLPRQEKPRCLTDSPAYSSKAT